MRQLAVFALLSGVLASVGCGTNSPATLNGNWTAALVSSSNAASPVFNFTLVLAQTGAGSISITNLNFTSANPCFATGSTATGGFTLSGDTSGVTSGGFQMNIESGGGAGGNQLFLQGVVNNNTINGSWTLTGTTAGCTGSGSFTMLRN